MSNTGSSKQRDKDRTKERLIEAVISIIREQGYGEVGVNAVAERAGVSKVLIYRYFGDLDGLYRAAAEHLDPLQAEAAAQLMSRMESESFEDGSTSLHSMVRRTILDLHMALKDDELTKNLLIWELANSNSITEAFSRAREETGLRLTEQYRQWLEEHGSAPTGDLNALMALVTAGVFYLTLRSDTVSEYNGVDIGSEEGWKRIADAFADLVARRPE